MSSVAILHALWAVVGCIAGIVAFPGSIELLLVTFGALLPPSKKRAGVRKGFRLAAVVPAHNEERSIAGCLSTVFEAQRSDLDLDVFVVADNCSDHTAEVARHGGAQVLVRHDEVHRGKGYALDYAFTRLLTEGYDGFVIIDADTYVEPNLFQEVATALSGGADAVQCRYLVRNSSDSTRTRLMSIALMAFNVVRPRGRTRLGLSAGICGNGFGLSADTLRAVPYVAASVVEDLEYHLLLVRSGRRVQFLDRTAVYGEIPAGGKGVETQRSRWEGGRFRMLATEGPRLGHEVLGGKFRMLEPLLELLLLPLAFHVPLLLLAVAVPFIPARILGIFGLSLVFMHLATAAVIGKAGARDLMALTMAPFYILWKLLLIPKLLRNAGAHTSWVRTERVPERRPR